MGRHELEYPRDAVNSVRRHASDRANYALETIHGLVNSAQMVHVSFNPPGSAFPVTLPMIGQMGSFERPSASLGDPLDLYLHGYVSARIFGTARASSSPSSSGDGTGAGTGDGDAKGMPVCVAASHVDGLVLALSPFNHSYNYRSAVLFGHAALVDDDDEKLYAMELITDSVVPDRWRNTRQPPTRAEMQSTSILRVSIASGSAKIREGAVVDDKHDLDSEATLDAVWTGVVPIYSSAGEPVPAAHNRVGLPSHLSEYVDDFSRENKERSIAAASDK